MKKFALCVLFLSLFTLSAHADTTNYTQNLNLPTFNKVDITGLANVQIHGRAKRTSVQITGDRMSIRYPTAAVKNDTLYITTQPEYAVKNGRLTVIVNAPALTQIRYTGSGQVKADQMSLRILTLLVELNKMGKTILVATHDLNLIRQAKAQIQARVLRIAKHRVQLAGADL